MSDLRARVAYLNGLAEGLDLDTSSAEGRVIASMIDVLEEMADVVEAVTDAQDELSDYVEEVDEDLSALEHAVLEEEGEGREVLFFPEEQLVSNEDGVELLSCPDCGETLAAGAGAIEHDLDVVCPVCGCSLQTLEEEH